MSCGMITNILAKNTSADDSGKEIERQEMSRRAFPVMHEILDKLIPLT